MGKSSFDLRLKGYVGGMDFDRSQVDAVLDKTSGPVSVLIDSTGGSLATGLSISAAFSLHGDVSVHFVGLNASAATIASLGAKRITMDAGAMYLVHKCSMPFFEWASMNADDFATLIAECEKSKEELNKLDENVARLYAARCKRTPKEMLALMAKGGWLSPQEALAWGFVDEITSNPSDKPARLTDAVASAMAAEGMPLPPVPCADDVKSGILGKLFASLSAFFKSEINQSKNYMNKTFAFICAVLGVEALVITDSQASISEGQLETIEAAMAANNDKIKALEDSLTEKDAKIAELQAKLDAKPAASTSTVVEDSKKKTASADDAVSQFCAAGATAADLFNNLP